ncbi:MAG: cobalt ECF transporter T component CbiQ [Acidimicrobiales bacterium]
MSGRHGGVGPPLVGANHPPPGSGPHPGSDDPGQDRRRHLAPEVKLVGLLGFVTGMAVTPRHGVVFLLGDLAVLAGAIAWARLPPGTVARRLTVVLPFLLAALALPLVAGGEQVNVAGIGLSVDGLGAGAAIAAKAVLGAGASIVVAATTPVADLITGLGRLRLPPVIVSIVAFMFRYLDLVGDEAARMRRAMTARGMRSRWLGDAGPLLAATGALFVRSYERGERVHRAMLARGYTGVMPDPDRAIAPLRQWSVAVLVSAPAWILAGVAAWRPGR